MNQASDILWRHGYEESLADETTVPNMSPEFHEKVRQLYDEALALPRTKRSRFLDFACADAPDVRCEVARLLEAAEPAESAPKSGSDAASRPKKINRYEIKGELGHGAMGAVYEAVDPVIGRTVALKVLHAKVLTDADEAKALEDRLFREASSAGRLAHPGIVTVFDVGKEGDMAFIAMERVEGPTLQQVIKERKLERVQAIELLRQAALALDYAHGEGIIHRDVKPANIMLHKGLQAKIADFGIAKVSTMSQLTVAGTILGTPSYMSPEQIQNLVLSGRSDQFSLAVVAYEVLTGSRPFTRDTVAALLLLIVNGQRPSACAADPTLPPMVDDVFQMAFSKSPDSRFATCSAFVNALGSAMGIEPAIATGTGSGIQSKIQRATASLPRQIPPADSIQTVAQVAAPLPPPPPQSFSTPPTQIPAPFPPPQPKRPPTTAIVLGIVALIALLAAWPIYRYIYPKPVVENTRKEKKEEIAIPPAGAKAGAPVVSLFTAEPDTIRPGGTATLRWWVTDASEVVINHDIGKVAAKGSIEVKPDKATEYVLTGTGPGGDVTAKVTVGVSTSTAAAKEPPPVQPENGIPGISIFSVKPTTIRPGQSAQLTWSVQGALKVSIDNGIGPVATEATQAVAPGKTTTYTLTAIGRTGPATGTVTVNVENEAPKVDIARAEQLYEEGAAKHRGQSGAAAIPIFQQAAGMGEPRAMLELGKIYAAGDGVGKDPAEAARWYRKAADLGNPSAMVFLGALYAQGSGVPKDLAEAAKWIRKAADAGNAVAMDGLGQMYMNGQGLPIDAVQAEAWYRKAVQNGNVPAMYHLGLMLENGSGPVAKNTAEATQLFQRAASAGYAPAKAKATGGGLTLTSIDPAGIVENKSQLYRLNGSGFSANTTVHTDVPSSIGSRQGQNSDYHPVAVAPNGSWLAIYIMLPPPAGRNTVRVIVKNPGSAEAALDVPIQR
jgi:serine/threonine protein kinase